MKTYDVDSFCLKEYPEFCKILSPRIMWDVQYLTCFMFSTVGYIMIHAWGMFSHSTFFMISPTVLNVPHVLHDTQDIPNSNHDTELCRVLMKKIREMVYAGEVGLNRPHIKWKAISILIVGK